MFYQTEPGQTKCLQILLVGPHTFHQTHKAHDFRVFVNHQNVFQVSMELIKLTKTKVPLSQLSLTLTNQQLCQSLTINRNLTGNEVQPWRWHFSKENFKQSQNLNLLLKAFLQNPKQAKVSHFHLLNSKI